MLAVGGNAESQVAEIVRARLAFLRRRKGELITELRQGDLEIVKLEGIQDVIGARTVQVATDSEGELETGDLPSMLPLAPGGQYAADRLYWQFERLIEVRDIGTEPPDSGSGPRQEAQPLPGEPILRSVRLTP